MSYKCVSVLGLGYIGLPTAAVLASNGIKVLGVDINKHIVDSVNAGKIHIEEPHLDKVVKEAVEKDFLKLQMRQVLQMHLLSLFQHLLKTTMKVIQSQT